MKVKAKLKNLRISPRKVRVSADIIRGCKVTEAIFRLENTVKKSNDPIKKLLLSAVANAQNNFNLDKETLIISDIQVQEGITMKRWMPRAYGRASEILKRSSHVAVILEGKEEVTKKKVNKKSINKKEKVKTEDKTEGTSETVEKNKEANQDKVKLNNKSHYRVEAKKKESRDNGWGKKIFRNKV